MDEEQVVVLKSSSPSNMPMIKSLLRSADIPFVTQDQSLDRIFPSGLHVHLFSGEPMVDFLVPASRAEEARALLAQRPELAEPLPEELREPS